MQDAVAFGKTETDLNVFEPRGNAVEVLEEMWIPASIDSFQTT
jgi:hypothetical protein